MNDIVKAAVVAAMVVSGLSVPRQAAAYSVLAHEANIDALWDSTIAPLLLARFPGASREQVLEARGYAYGGCVIQDLGYYPLRGLRHTSCWHRRPGSEAVSDDPAAARDARPGGQALSKVGA